MKKKIHKVLTLCDAAKSNTIRKLLFKIKIKKNSQKKWQNGQKEIKRKFSFKKEKKNNNIR